MNNKEVIAMSIQMYVRVVFRPWRHVYDQSPLLLGLIQPLVTSLRTFHIISGQDRIAKVVLHQF